MSEKINISTSAFNKLFETHMKQSSEEAIRELFRMVIETAGSRMSELIDYLDDPKAFIHPEHKCQLGSTIIVDKDAMYSSEKKHYEENNLLIDNKWFTATVISFNFIKSDYIIVEYPNEKNKLVKREIYGSYINNEKLL